MKRMMLATVVVFAFGCNHRSQQTAALNEVASSTPAPAAQDAQQQSSGASATSAVQLVGCLQGPAQPRAATGAPPSAATTDADHGANATAHYVLADVRIESGGVGANGAGGSGGPLLSAGTSVDLDGVPADAQNSVNKQVRITGRIDARPASVGDTSRARDSARNNGTSGSGIGASTEVPGTTAGTTGSASPRDDVRANSTGVAGGIASNGTPRRVTVERVETIAQTCASTTAAGGRQPSPRPR
jgi:hypothetical protein